MSVTVKMTGNDADLVKAQDRVAKGAAGITAEYRQLAKESQEVQRFAKRAWEESLSPAQKYHDQLKKLVVEKKNNTISSDEYRAAVLKIKGAYDQAGKAGTDSMKAVHSELGIMLGSLLSVGGAVATISKSYDTWVQNTREIATQTRETMKDVVAFAAMQEPGEARQRAMRVLDVAAGRAAFAEAFDLAQAMQSSIGTFEGGLKAMDQVLSATQVGIPAALGREIAVQAMAQQEDPSRWLRGIYLAGEISRRDPEQLATGVAAYQNFRDKTTAMAVSAQLAGTFGPELMAYTRQAAYGLSGVSGAAKWFTSQGLGADATEMQRLAALQAAGIDTLEELAAVGFTEIRQADAIKNLVSGYQDVVAYKAAIDSRIGDEALLQRKRTALEAGLPEAALSRTIAEEESRFMKSRSFGGDAMRRQLWEKTLSAELSAAGINQGTFGLGLFDQQGNINWKSYYATRAAWVLPPGVQPQDPFNMAVQSAERRYQQSLDAIQQNTTKTPPRPRVPSPE